MREFVLENGGVGAFHGTLSDGGSRVVDPRPIADGERRGSAGDVLDGDVAALYMRDGDSMVFADGAVRALLTAGGKFNVGQWVPVQALVSANVGEVNDGEGEAWKAA